jgi:hypothetical protein
VVLNQDKAMSLRSAVVLNADATSTVELDHPVDIALTLAMADLKAQFINTQKGTVQYENIRGSEAFERFKSLSGKLRSYNYQSLRTREQKLAFWINIYNITVIHGVIELSIQRSVRDFPHFFDRVTYEIGGYYFSLNDIEHGILRGNRRPPYRLFKPFRGSDTRSELALVPMDPRIHFALVCGARSCPPIGFYEADQIDFQLQLAAASFINSPQVAIEQQEMAVSISMIFKWYKIDFGGTGETLLNTLFQFLDEGEKKEFLMRNKDRIRIRYQPYDWSLNRE